MFIFVSKQDDDLGMKTMFDTLLQLPLFQGLAQADFTDILEKVKLQFTTYKEGEVILESGGVCEGLVFILKGEVAATTSFQDVPYSLVEFFSAPYLIEFHSLFGMKTSYVSRYTARTETHTVRISKCYVIDVLLNYEIFRLNCLNILCNRIQVLSNHGWMVGGLDSEKRLASFFLSIVTRPVGPKIVRVKMRDLAGVLNDTRIGISKTLNKMEEEKLLKLRRGEIVIPAIEKLL